MPSRSDLRGERSWTALIDSLRHLATWLADILSRRERVMRSTIGMLFGSAGASMERECDLPEATWMVRLPVAELGSIRHESQCGVGSKGARRSWRSARLPRRICGFRKWQFECKISISS